MIYNDFTQRQLGSTIIAYNFEVLTASPLDPRTVVNSKNNLYDASAWFINNTIPTYLYPGLVVTNIKEDNDTLKQYVYNGKPYVADSSDPQEQTIPGIWQCITFTNNSNQVKYPLTWGPNPDDIGTNLNQNALYFGDSSNGEISLSNNYTGAKSIFKMNDNGISLLYDDSYHIDITKNNGINIYKDNEASIKLINNTINSSASEFITDSSSYIINSKNNINISSGTITQYANTLYNIKAYNGIVDVSNLTINDTSLYIKNNEQSILSKVSTYSLVRNKIYTSDYTIFYKNPDDILNNISTTDPIPCIQIFENIPENKGISLSLSNYIKQNRATLDFHTNGVIHMHTNNNIAFDTAGNGDITLHNDIGTISMGTNSNAISIDGRNKVLLNAGQNNLAVTDTSISIKSDNIQLWNNQYTLPVPDRDKVELLRFNKDRLEWTDSALLKAATINRKQGETNKPAAIRIAQAIYTYNAGNTHELWKPSITFAVNTEEGSGIFNAQVLPIATTPDKVDYKLNIQCINNRNMFNNADNIPYVTGRIYYMNNDQYKEHPYDNPNSTVICEIYIVTSYNTANWAYLSYTHDGEITENNPVRNIWKLTDSIIKTDGDNTISIPSGIETGITWDVTKKMYTQHEVLPHIVKSINFTSVGTTRYSFNEIPYPVESDRGKFLQVDSDNNFVWQEAAMKTYNAEGKNYIIGSLDPSQGKTLTKGTYQDQVYFTNTGDMYARNYYATSDINKKTDIHNILNNTNIHTVAFKWKDTSIQSYGFIAQELEKTNPELINTDEDGSKTVNYIAALSLYTAQLEQRIAKLEKIIESNVRTL